MAVARRTTLAVLGLLVAAAPAGAIVITGGPTYSPGGGWSCTAPSPGSEKLGTGSNFTCSGTAGAFTNLYLGVNTATAFPFGDKMNSTGGSEPSGVERFVWSANGVTTIRYTGQTAMGSGGPGTVFTRVTLTFSNTGAVVDDATTQALTGANINGSVHALWRIGAAVSSLNVTILIEASTSAGGPFSPAATLFGTTTSHRQGTGTAEVDRSHVDLAFYTSSCGDGQLDGTEQCDQGSGVNGTPGSCCSSTCQSAAAGTPCTDTSPTSTGNCKDAQCNGSGVCDQNFANETNGTACVDGLFCNGTDQCDAGACTTHSGDPCPGADGDADCSESCSEAADNCLAADPNGVPCTGNGTGDCTNADTCSGGTCADNDVATGTGCPDDGSACTTDTCDGTGTCTHPAGNPGATCRVSAGVCDPQETCTGSSPSCPDDAKSTAECRASADVCDAAESCDGVGDDCPADQPQPSTFECRPAADVCDTAENCDGVGNDCPADQPQPSTFECRPAADLCDVAENCDGVAMNCPPDAIATVGTECRAVAGDCDVAESCDGSSVACPTDTFVAATEVCRPSAGDCDVAESCTGTSAECPADAFQPSTQVCRPATGVCELAENCTGSSPTCPIDEHQPDGTTCDDGQTCTLDDMCVAGVCTGDSMLCGNGTIEGGCGEECDDGNTTSNDGCSATCQVEFLCSPSPIVGCLRPFVPGKASFQLKDKSPDDTKDSLRWKWVKGERTVKGDFGTPLTTTDYLLCVYDASSLILDATIPAGGICAGKPCWSDKTTGFNYKDKELTPDGIKKIVMRQGADGKAKIIVQGKGGNLQMPMLPVTQPVTVQLLNNTNGVCWEAVYSAPATKNDSTQFKDKAD